MRTAVIMQPTYLPWMGYFDLMDRADIFVFYDNVQFDKRSWQQRNRIKGLNGTLWLTVPVFSKGKYYQNVNEVSIADTSYYKNHLETIKYCYSKSPYYEAYIEQLRKAMGQSTSLCDENIGIINLLAELIGISIETTLSSKLGEHETKVDGLVNVCKAVNADKYLTPNGARGYIEQNNTFAENGIVLEYQDYKHPTYKQLYGEFTPYMSVIDLLFNEGERSLDIIRSGR